MKLECSGILFFSGLRKKEHSGAYLMHPDLLKALKEILYLIGHLAEPLCLMIDRLWRG